MLNTGKFAGRTVIISGGSRGIGKAVALKLAKDGANVSILAKTTTPHPKLPGTIYTAAEEIEKAGGKALPCVVDVRDEASVQKAVEDTVKKFGGIDICINNASAISLTGTLDTSMKRYDLMHGINTRGTFLLSKMCIPYLKQGTNPHILNMSPPLLMEAHWFSNHVAYTMAKYGMSMCVLGMHEELRPNGIAVNALWPKTPIWTAAMELLSGGNNAAGNRTTDIVADAAYVMLSRNSREFTGNFAIDEDILKEEGVTDFDKYACVPGVPLMSDFFVPGVKSYDPSSFNRSSSRSAVTSADIQKSLGRLRNIINPEFMKIANAVYEFHLRDDGSTNRTLYLDLKNGNGSMGEGSSPNKADVVFEAKTSDFLEILDGKLSPSRAFMSQQLKIRGDVTQAMKLESIIKALNKK